MRASRICSTLIGFAMLLARPAGAVGPFDVVYGEGLGLYPASVWAISGSDVFVGGGASSLRYDGIRWNKVAPPAECARVPLDEQASCGSIKGLWGASGTDVFGLSASGKSALVHYDGTSWSFMNPPPQYADGQHGLSLGGPGSADYSIWGSAGNDVYVVGSRHGNGDMTTSGVVLHYDGAAWSEVVVPQSGPSDYFASVWGRSASDVYVGGRDAIRHYDGASWTVSLSFPGVVFHQIRGTHGGGVIAVGEQWSTHSWILMHFDGTAWHPWTAPVSNPRIVGTTGDDVYFLGNYQANAANGYLGKLARYSAAGWSELPESPVYRVWGPSFDDCFGLSEGAIHHFDGTAWRPVETLRFSIAWGSSARDVYGVGKDSIVHYDGTGWTTLPTPPATDLQDLWGSSGSDLFAVGGKLGFGTVLHYDGTAWSRMPVPDGSTLRAVWGAAPDAVFAAGQLLNETCFEGFGCYMGRGLLLRYDGSAWSEMPLPDVGGRRIQQIWDVWGSSASDVFAIAYVYDEYCILHYDGTGWSRMAAPPSTGLFGIWGSSGNDVYAVGRLGSILHYDGIVWSAVAYDVTVPYFSGETWDWVEVSAHDQDNLQVWGSAANDVYVRNGEAALLHFDGSAWSNVPTPCVIDRTCYNFGQTWGSSATDVYVSSQGTVLHYGLPGPSWLSAGDGEPGGSVRISWERVAGVTGYQVHGSPRGVFDFRTIAQVDADTTTYDDPLGCGSRGYDYKVAAVFADGSLSAFSPADVGFSGGCAPPAILTLVSPAGLTWTTTPTYTWNAQPGASSYQLRVGTSATTVLSAWYTAEQAGCVSGTGPCSVTPATTLADGPWEFTVQGRNDLGAGPWAAAKIFNVSTTPTALTLYFPYKEYQIQPYSYVGYSWKAQPGVDSYQLWVGTGSSTAHSAWYAAADIYCQSGTGVCYAQVDEIMPVGTWYFNVRGRNAQGTGPWTAAKLFVVGSAPSAPTLLSPSGVIATATPTFQWNPVPGADFYQLWVGTGSTSAMAQWYSAAAAGCGEGTGTCSVTLATPLAPGTWHFNVKSKGAAGSGAWAAPQGFTYAAAAAPTKLTLLAPSGPAGTQTPAFSWSAQAGVDTYQLWVGSASTTAYSVWYQAAAAGCGTGESTCTVTPGTALTAGSWYFNVRGRNLAGTGPWTTAKGFSTP